MGSPQMQSTSPLNDATDVPRISVVIPCFNVENLVSDAVQTVLDQSYPVEEIVCVDDGSQDNTLNVLRTLARSEPAIVVESLDQQRGASAARNRGLEMISGDYVQFLDADDLLEPRKLEHQARLVAECSFTPDFIAAAYKKERLDDAVEEKGGSVPVHPDEWIGLISAELGITSANLWRTASVDSVGGFSEDYDQSTEAELMFRLLCNGAKVLCDPEIYTTIRRRSDSLWHDTPGESRKSWLRLRWRIQNYLEENDLLTNERKQVLQRQAFIQISALYPLDNDFAIQMHRNMIGEAFNPNQADIKTNKIYSLIYSMFGLRYAEAARTWWHALRQIR